MTINLSFDVRIHMFNVALHSLTFVRMQMDCFRADRLDCMHEHVCDATLGHEFDEGLPYVRISATFGSSRF